MPDLSFEEGKDYYDCILKKFVESYCEHNFENNAVSCPLCNEKNPNYEDPTAEKQYLYLKPNNNWKVDGARFAMNYFGTAAGWLDGVDSNNDGIYEFDVTSINLSGVQVIFCRMNPNATANNWNNKWNQTADLTIPTNGNNLYTINDGSWDKGTWSKFGA